MKAITIITDYNQYSGAGHIMRMASLATFLQEKEIDVKIYTSGQPDFFPAEKNNLLVDKIPTQTDLFIRDFRDSEGWQIRELQEMAPVCVIDDCGLGREEADLVIDLLPNLTNHGEYAQDSFLYGYNFQKGISDYQEEELSKDIDLAIYPEILGDKNLEQLLSQGKNLKILVMQGEKSFLQENGKRVKIDLNESRNLLMRAKCLLSHFGITLFEGLLTKTQPIIINPTEYHAQLTALIAQKQNLLNLGLIEELNISTLIEYISDFPVEQKVNVNKIQKELNQNYHNFLKRISIFNN